jgi:P pilus assembly chaperone PapD
MTRALRLSVGALLSVLAVSSGAAAQVSISPVIVFLKDASRISDFTVGSTSDRAQEVTIDFRFGYMRSDTVGNLAMEYGDSAAAARHSMANWVSAFPRRFVLRPGTKQTVRIIARAPPNLAPGTYWTRLITASLPQSAPIDSATAGVSTQITVRLEQVTTVLYRRGEAVSGVAIGALALHRDSAGAHLLIPVSARDGSAFLGTSTVRFRNERGEVVHEVRAPLAVYFEQVQRVTLPAAVGSGAYRAEVSIQAGRQDVPTWTPRAPPPTTATLQFTRP